jgi:TolB-like protein
MNIAVVVLLVIAIGLLALDRFFVPEQNLAVRQEQPAQVPADDGRIDSIAVLPFADFSAAGDLSYLGDGIADTVLHMLAGVQGLRVAARTSSFRFREENVDIATIGEQLSVQSVLEGSVQLSGEKLRIIAQLVRTSDQSHIWSQTFDRNSTDIFAIQDEIANAVAAQFGGEAPVAQEEISSQRTSPEVYAQVLQARQLSHRRTAPDIEQAIELLTRAIDADPGYAAAHSELAAALNFKTMYGSASRENLKSRILEEVEKALALDPNDAAAYAVRSFYYEWPAEMDQSRADLERALELDPSNVEAMTWLANRLEEQGEYAESMALRQKAYEIDPLNVQVRRQYAFQVMTREGDIDRAIAIGEETVALGLNPTRALKTLAELNMVSGRLGGVAKAYFREAKVSPENPGSYFQMAAWMSFLGEREISNAWFEIAKELRPELEQSQHYFFRAERGEAEALLAESEQRLAGNPGSVELLMDVFKISSQMGRFDRAIEIGERILEEVPEQMLQQNMMLSLFLNSGLAMIHKQLGNREEAVYFEERFMAGVERRLAAGSSQGYENFMGQFFTGLVKRDYDLVADTLENLPIAKPLMYGNLTFNALYKSALEHPRVRAWYDDFVAQIEAAREEIRAIDDPVFRNPRLLKDGAAPAT